MTTLLINLTVAAALFIVLMLGMFLAVSREEACVAAYRHGEPLSAYCSRLFE
jgi:hypothetical protein